MNNDLITRRIKPPPPPDDPFAPSREPAPPPLVPGRVPRWPTTDREFIPWDRPDNPDAVDAERIGSQTQPPEASAPAPGPSAVPSDDQPFERPAPADFLQPDLEFVSASPPWDGPPDELWAAADLLEAAAREPVAENSWDVFESDARWRPELANGYATPPTPEAPADESEHAADVGAAAQLELADPDDSLAPVADDLLVTAEAIELLPREPIHDGPFTSAGDTDVSEAESVEALAPPEAVLLVPDSTPEPPRAWSSSGGGYSSVFGDLFVTRPRPHLHEQIADAHEPEQAELTNNESLVQELDPVDWPPVPTGLFPPLPHLLPTLNLVPAVDDELALSWPDDPQPQTFWPNELTVIGHLAPLQAEGAPEPEIAPQAAAEPHVARESHVARAPDVPPHLEFPAQVEMAPAALAAPPAYPRLVFDNVRPESRYIIRQLPVQRPALIFSDPPPSFEVDAEAEAVATGDGGFARFANQASAFAERIPDRWSLVTAPSPTATSDEALAHDLAQIQSPALTVLFAIMVIGAVLLFIYLVTPLLR